MAVAIRRVYRLVIELAQTEGGGEGVLLSLAPLAKQYCDSPALDY